MFCRALKSNLSLLGAMILLGATGLYGSDDRAAVSNVTFQDLRPTNGTDQWLEMDIELDARPGSSSPGRVTGSVRVVAMLAYDRPSNKNGPRWEFYRASAELVGLTAGRAHVRFYLPPEIVKRDSLAGAPKYWEVLVSGESLVSPKPVNRISSNLTNKAAHQGFLDKIATEGSRNDGIMQPQFLTPFSSAYPRATPTYVRAEAWR